MQTHTHKGRALAIAAGVAFAAGGLTILLDKDLTHPIQWASAQWLTILTVGGTIAAGHLMVDAWRARHVFATLGFLTLFLSGTGLVVYSSVGRQVETAGTTLLSVEDTNKKIAEKTTDLQAAKSRRDYANQAADNEMTGQRCGKRCKDWQQNSRDITVVINQLEADIGTLGPQRPVNAQAAAMADIGALFGFGNRAQIIAALLLLIPFAKCLFFEIGAIVSLGFAFRARPVSISALISKENQSGDRPPQKPNGKRPHNRLPANVVPFSHPVVATLEKHGPVSSNRRLAELMSVSEGEASKRCQEIEHLLDVHRVGKQLSIALRQTA
jgi:hypothetical protein